MDRFSSLFVIAAIAGSFYFVKNIKISVSGAEAVEASVEEPFEAEAEVESEAGPTVAEAQVKTSGRKPQSFQRSQKDPIYQLVSLIQARELCQFLQVAKDNGLGQVEQMKALSLSLGDEKFDELWVFLDGDLKSIDDYQSVMAQSYLIAKDREAFANMSFSGGDDFTKGMKPRHKELLQQIESLAAREPGNLFFAMLRNDVFHRYTNVDDETKAKLFEQAIATTHYENPVHNMVRDLYQNVKSNVVQFYLAQKILFDLPVGVDDNFIGRSIWRFYDEGLRYHINGLLAKNLENVSRSNKTFGYESGVYNAYRNSLHYTEYEAALDLKGFESSKVQPTYDQEDLRLKFDGPCDPAKVVDLEIKLRAL